MRGSRQARPTGDRAVAIRPARPADAEALARLRRDLWPDGPLEEHVGELTDFFASRAPEPLEILVAEDAGGRVIGFCELSIRAYAEGCRSQRVGYLEGWYVAAGARRRGVGAALVRAGEQWARRNGCREFASDAEADNAASIAAHRALGFEDQGLIRCFSKVLERPSGDGDRGPGAGD